MEELSSYAMVVSGKVANLIVWDGNAERWSPPEGVEMIKVEPGQRVDIGDGYDGAAFIPVGDPWVGS